MVVAGLPVLSLVLYTGLEHRHQAMAQAQAHILQMARVISRDQQQSIEFRRQLLITLAQLPAVQQYDGAACSAIFSASLESHRRYTNLGAFAPDGRVFCSAVPVENLAGRFNANSSEWFQDALRNRGFAVSDYHIGGITGKPVLTMACPALGRRRVRAVVFASLDLNWLSNSLAANFPRISVVTVVDRQGTVLPAIEPESGRGLTVRGWRRSYGDAGNRGWRTIGIDGRRHLRSHPLGLARPGTERLCADWDRA